MGRLLIENQTTPATPGAGETRIFVDSADKETKQIDDTGTVTSLAAAAGLPVVDTISIVEGSVDATKEMRIEVDGLTTATVRVATMPDKDITFNQDAQYKSFYNNDDSESTTTGTAFIEKVKLTFTALAADYDITWSCDISQDTAGEEVKYQFQEDGTTLNAGEIQSDTNDGASFTTVGGTVRRTLTAASHDFDIDFSSTTGGNTARIRNARILAIQAI